MPAGPCRLQVVPSGKKPKNLRGNLRNFLVAAIIALPRNNFDGEILIRYADSAAFSEGSTLSHHTTGSVFFFRSASTNRKLGILFFGGVGGSLYKGP